MTVQQRLGVSAGVLALAFVVTVTPANAYMYQSQSQSAFSESSSSFSCEGDGCSGKSQSKSSIKLHQQQSQGTGAAPTHTISSGRTRHRVSTWRDTSGEVRLNWDHRGGTCHVRYTESGSRYFKYSTSAACDEGGITIGGLTPGHNYRFQVRKDGGGWSATVTRRAE